MGTLVGAVPGWEHLDDDERATLLDDTDWLLREKRWESARDFELTHAIRVHIAAQAALLILGLPRDVYRRVRTVVVRADALTLHGEQAGLVPGLVSSGPTVIIGQASHGTGPVLVAWNAVRADARHRARGHNVVFHEFAHKIDMADDLADGRPPIADPALRARWTQVCADAFARLSNGTDEGALRYYAATNLVEFFAVATEVFFTNPDVLAELEPALYDVLSDFYRQDPLSRSRRAESA